jgi:preprotein translocase subunit SecE
VARQTRAQRRARRARAQRAETGDAAAIARPQPAAARQPVRAVQPEVSRPAERHFPGTRFISESWAELKKVEWPTQSQIIQATVVVLIACTIVGVYLWGADLVLRRLVEQVFLK